jgi:adenylyltransferase/sulfurtransferase
MQPVVPDRHKLTPAETTRYSRHLLLPEVGPAGQECLKAAKVLLIGAGGLGSPIALYLTAAGIGTIGMVDFDVVEFSNLHRQIIHFTGDVGHPKLQSVEAKLKAMNPGLRFIPFNTKLTAANALDIFKDFDLVVDGTDNFPTRYLVNDACTLLQKPNVYGSIYRWEGLASVFAPHLGGPCYRCWYPEPPAPGQVLSCAEAGVLGVVCGIIGSIQANEAVKLILGQGEPLLGRLLRFNAMKMTFREHQIPRDPGCPLCGSRPTITKLKEIAMTCATGADDITVEQLKAMRDRREDFLLVDVRNPDEFAINEIAGSKKLPLPDLPARFAELPKDKLIVLHCKMGGRSARALQFLRSQGYRNLKNVAGGITAWADRIDPTLPRSGTS